MPFFKVPNDYPLENARFEQRADGLYKQVNAICWFTNVPNDSNRETLIAYKKYSAEEYPTYDNYSAIECGRMENFPTDYNDVIGIPITGLKYLHSDGYLHIEIDGNDTQFEIIGITENAEYLKPLYIQGCEKYDRPYINGQRMYSRLLIKKVS